MKKYRDYKEMTYNILKARDEYEEKKRKRLIAVKKCMAAVSAACLTVFVAVYSLKKADIIPEAKKSTEERQLVEIVTSNSEAVTPVTSQNQITKKTEVTVKDHLQTSPAAVTTVTVSESSLKESDTVKETALSTINNTVSEKETVTLTAAEEITTQPAESKEQGSESVTSAVKHESSSYESSSISETSENDITKESAPDGNEENNFEENNDLTSESSKKEGSVDGGTTDVNISYSYTNAKLLIVPDTSGNSETVLPWDERNTAQKYKTAKPDEPASIYKYYGYLIDASLIGEYLSDASMTGRGDPPLEEKYRCKAKAYRVSGFDPKRVVAIKFEDDDNYYYYNLYKS